MIGPCTSQSLWGASQLCPDLSGQIHSQLLVSPGLLKTGRGKNIVEEFSIVFIPFWTLGSTLELKENHSGILRFPQRERGNTKKITFLKAPFYPLKWAWYPPYRVAAKTKWHVLNIVPGRKWELNKHSFSFLLVHSQTILFFVQIV